jgi:hypothetical protein
LLPGAPAEICHFPFLLGEHRHILPFRADNSFSTASEAATSVTVFANLGKLASFSSGHCIAAFIHGFIEKRGHPQYKGRERRFGSKTASTGSNMVSV